MGCLYNFKNGNKKLCLAGKNTEKIPLLNGVCDSCAKFYFSLIRAAMGLCNPTEQYYLLSPVMSCFYNFKKGK